MTTPLTPPERLRELFDRLGSQPASQSAEEAYRRVVTTLNEVETEMALVDDVACLANEVLHGPGFTKTEISSFPSGAVSLLIHLEDRAFELAYLPSTSMFGVDELEADGAFDSGYRFGFHDFSSARAKLLDMVDEARVASAPKQ